MDIRDYIDIVRSKLWFVILGALLAGLTCAITYQIWPSYEASATLLLQDASSRILIHDGQKLNIAQQTLSALATRAPLIDDVVEILDLDISAKDLANLIQIRTPKNASIIEIAVTHRDPLMAASIVNTLMQELQVHSAPNIKTVIIASAGIPQKPIQSFYLLTIIAGALGFTVTTAALLLGDRLHDTVQHERDIEKKLGIPILGKFNTNSEGNQAMGQAAIQSYQWIFMNIFMNRVSTPSTLLVTSPKNSKLQSHFVHKFVNQNLRGELQIEQEKVLLDSSLYSEAISKTSEPVPPISIMQGPFYELAIDEAVSGIDGAQQKPCRHIKVVDAPPLLSNANTMMLAQRFDTVLLVIEENKTKIRDIQKTKQLLGNVGTPIIGSVLLIR